MELFKRSKCLAIIAILFVFTIFSVYWMNWFANSAEKLRHERGVNANFISRLPNAIIIGSNKSGTRALLVFLKIHPDIRACPYEVHFFDQDENYSRGLEWYRQNMPKSLPHQLTIEKTPAYLLTEIVPERVFNMSKGVKLLVIVRDPTERAISDYTQLSLKSTSNPLPPFEEYVLKNENVINKNKSIVKSGVYIRYLKHWMKFFPLSQIHFVSGENLIKNPAAELKLVEKFLNLRPVITEKNFYINKIKGFPCFIGKIGLRGKKKTGCLKDVKGRKHVQVRKDVRTLLQNYYQPYNQELYKVVKRNFHWP
ncbi:heparan sulfate glucosamine 3-O-sulfotransferase 2-like [Montipora foliosa]|uniref:heparan sulfate glucosamine 3-O-sulfotransferase 2-like n=1 Tax=Montipora foliosa TaxID=591990 RepID=UPI0035F14698